jgi:hypothetical protein
VRDSLHRLCPQRLRHQCLLRRPLRRGVRPGRIRAADPRHGGPPAAACCEA